MEIIKPAILFLLILAYLIASLMLTYWIKSILKANGYKVSWFVHMLPFEDASNLFKLAKTTSEPEKARSYRVMAYGNILSIVLFPLLIFLFIYTRLG